MSAYRSGACGTLTFSPPLGHALDADFRNGRRDGYSLRAAFRALRSGADAGTRDPDPYFAKVIAQNVVASFALIIVVRE